MALIHCHIQSVHLKAIFSTIKVYYSDPAKKSAELSAKIRDLEKDISARKKYIISMKEHKLKQISTWSKAEILAIEQTAANKKKLGRLPFLVAPTHR